MKSYLIFSLILLSLLASPIQANITATPEVIHAQGKVSFNVTLLQGNEFVSFHIEEFYNNTLLYAMDFYNVTKTSNTSYVLHYQMTKEKTDSITVTVIYTMEGKSFDTTVIFIVLGPEPISKEISYIAIGFVIFCVVLGSYWTYKFVKRRLW
jgi:hypothetical protein